MYEYGMYNSNDEKRKERFHALLSLQDSLTTHGIDNSRANVQLESDAMQVSSLASQGPQDSTPVG